MQGILTVFNKRSDEKFSSNDQKLLSIIASQSSQIIENARLLEEERNLQVMQEEMRVAKQTQINLLPKEFPDISGYQIAARTIPAKEVGGDSYDLIQIDDKHFAFCLGDVSGKGMPAAMLMSNLQATLRSFTITGNLCKDIIANSNDLLYNSTEPSKFVTLFYGILNPESNEIVFCNAGHNNPFLFSVDGNVKELITGGLILGCLPDSVHLVGVQRKHPLVPEASVRQRPVALAGKVLERMAVEVGTGGARQFQRAVGAAGVHHVDVVGPAHAPQAGGQICFLVVGENQD